MRLLLSLIGAQGDALARALGVGRRLRERGHELVFLGEFGAGVQMELARMGAAVVRQAQPEGFDAALMFSLGAPDRMAALARKLPTVLLVQESQLELMALKGDFVHWVSLFRAARRIVFLSEHQRDKVFASFLTGIDDAHVAVWHGTAAPAAWEPAPPQAKDYFGVVMCAGTGPQWRVQDLIAAGERLRDFSLLFTFVGPEGLAASLPDGARKVAERHPGRYTFVAPATPADMLTLIRRNDLYCESSADAACPQPVLDAAASRLPVMLADIAPLARDWVNGVNCLKFPVNRPDFLAALLRMLLQDDVLRNTLADAAQATVRRFGSADAYVDQVARLVETLRR